MPGERSFDQIDPLGRQRLGDVMPKEATHRRALARCKVFMKPETTTMVANNANSKGDVLAAARFAGIQGAKMTSTLIPLCQANLVGKIDVSFTLEDDYVEISAEVETVGRTGVEMEAVTAATIAGLTIYDMCKSSDRTMSIGDITLWEKTGGKAGVWRRSLDV
jgi:cyclic pyranopterin phosphate synthase